MTTTTSTTTDCFDLASSLSQNYRNVSPFDKSDDSVPLTEYLRTHGILLTMCFPFECTLPFGSDHISGSWINEQTGVEVIMGPQVGLVLDPMLADMKCVYPTDAASVSRDGQGCGPPILDPKYGSRGANSYNFVTRYFIRKAVTEYKNINFGVETDWLDIDCEYFFPGAVPPKHGQLYHQPTMLMWDVGPDGNIVYKSFPELLQEEHEAIMGHPVCTCKNKDDDEEWGFRVHQGSQGWDLLDWQRVIDMQIDFIREKTSPQEYSTHWNFNEIIMGMPKTQFQDMIMGVFYLDSPNMDDKQRAENWNKARDVAKVMGGKPFMRMQTEPGENDDLLTCAEDLEFPEIVTPQTSQGLGSSWDLIPPPWLTGGVDTVLGRGGDSFTVMTQPIMNLLRN